MNKKILSLILVAAGSVMSFGACSEDDVAVTETTVQTPPTSEVLAPILAPRESDTVTQTTAEPTGEHGDAPDTAAPLLVAITREANVELGTAFDIDSFISYIDDTDPNPSLMVTGNVNTAVTGAYPVSITIADASGNITTDSITVNVYEPVPDSGVVPDTSGGYSGTDFSEFMASYPGENIHYGIDVSHWQGAIDFNSVVASGCEFVIIRAGWSSDGEFHEDDYFQTNIQGATQAGLPIGVYVYTSDNTVQAVENLADTVSSLVDGYNLAFPVIYDWESFSKVQQYHLSIADLNDLYRAFDNRIQQHGLSSTLYGSKYYLDIIWDDSISPVWLAHYNSSTDYTGEYFIWQQSDHGLISGIDAYVDLDLYYGTLPGGS